MDELRSELVVESIRQFERDERAPIVGGLGVDLDGVDAEITLGDRYGVPIDFVVNFREVEVPEAWEGVTQDNGMEIRWTVGSLDKETLRGVAPRLLELQATTMCKFTFELDRGGLLQCTIVVSGTMVPEKVATVLALQADAVVAAYLDCEAVLDALEAS